MKSGKYHFPGNRQTQTRPSDCQTEKHDWLLQRTHLHCSRVQWQCALHHCIQCFALHLCHFTWPATSWLIFSSKEISWMDLLHRWQPITVPCFNSLSS
ncbi:unnamed protein product [Staurois parvus]|uniref:Uncharacterized protein n=1 Tax=Staurois parvus TaxID=386267 RepID=A0ABN9CIJ8_9NEOB|nr:unnamed protein product [Staurois parvus]